MEAPGHVPSVPSPKSGTGGGSVDLYVFTGEYIYDHHNNFHICQEKTYNL